jgi:hypothetical protein
MTHFTLENTDIRSMWRQFGAEVTVDLKLAQLESETAVITFNQRFRRRYSLVPGHIIWNITFM